MYLNLLSEITIAGAAGTITTRAITEGEIKTSWKELTDTCTFTMPRNLQLKGKRLDEWMRVGDAVTVKLAVNDQWRTEFIGYIREVDSTVPVRVFCEDEMWKLKQVPVVAKSWPQAEIADIINHIVPSDYTVEIFNGQSSKVTIGKFLVNNESCAQVLARLREYGIFSYFQNGKLYIGFPYDYSFNTHVLHFQKNLRQNNLKFRMAGDYKVQVKAIANLPNGQKTIELYPDATTGDSEVRTFNYGELSPDILERRRLLREYAKAEIKRINVDGYRGTVTTWGIFPVEHGDQVTLRDDVFADESTNVVDAVTKKWGKVFYTKEIEIGPRLSAVEI